MYIHYFIHVNVYCIFCCFVQCKSIGFVGAIGDVWWVEQVTSSMASHMLVLCPTPFERSHLLQLLHETQFGDNFKCSGKRAEGEERLVCLCCSSGVKAGSFGHSFKLL